jgi:DnaA family protein
MSNRYQLALDLLQPLTPTLNNFVVGRNAEALAMLRSVHSGAGEPLVYLWGPTGTGRTHLLYALGGCAPQVEHVPVFDPAQRLYLIDNVDHLTAAQQHALFVLINEVRAHPGTALVATGAAPPAQLALRDDLRTRLSWGLVYQLHALSDADKANALVTHAHSRGIHLPPELIHYLLAHLPRDMRTLIAALDALDLFALERKRALTLPLLREWFTHKAAA